MNREGSVTGVPEYRFEQKNIQTVVGSQIFTCPLVLPGVFQGNGTYLIEMSYQSLSQTLNRTTVLEVFIGFTWTNNGATVTFLNNGAGMAFSLGGGIGFMYPDLTLVSPNVIGLMFQAVGGLPSSTVETLYYGLVHKVSDVILTP